MKTIFHDKSNLGGIYRIQNVVNGKFYYGSTVRFKGRYKAHWRTLEAGVHTNTFMLNEYRKYGGDNFVFEVIEVVDGDEKARLAVEQTYLDKHYDGQKECMNISPIAAPTRTGKKQRIAGDPLTDKRFRKPSEETLEKRAKAIRQAKSTPEAKQRAAENCKNGLWAGHSAGVDLVNLTTGEEVRVNGSLREFAMSRGLSYKALHLMVKGKTKTSGGWKVK